ARIEHECRGDVLLTEPVEEFIEQSGLAGSYFAGEQNEALAGFDAVGQAGQRFLRMLRQKEIARVRVDVEGVLFQSEEVLIHERVPSPLSDSCLAGPGERVPFQSYACRLTQCGGAAAIRRASPCAGILLLEPVVHGEEQMAADDAFE